MTARRKIPCAWCSNAAQKLRELYGPRDQMGEGYLMGEGAYECIDHLENDECGHTVGGMSRVYGISGEDLTPGISFLMRRIEAEMKAYREMVAERQSHQ